MDWKRKLSSRKLWACVVGVIIGVLTIFGMNPNTVNTISGAIVAVSSVVSYIISEGRVDAQAVNNAAQKVEEAIKVVGGDAGD